MADTGTLTGTLQAIGGTDNTQAAITITASVDGTTVSTTTATISGSSAAKLSGTYTVSALPAGTVKVVFTSVKYQNHGQQVSISAGKTTTLDVTLTAKGLQF